MENYLFKKTEKIVSAIYLISNFIKDNDPVKWELREQSMSLISISSAINGTVPVDKNNLLQSYISSSFEMLSLIKIISNAGLISQMNFSIIMHEIESLIEFIKKQSSDNAHATGFILSDNFFSTDIQVPQTTLIESQIPKKNIIKDKVNIKDKKNNRQNDILNLLKKSSNLTIKDFTKVIVDCSEKTIQRELIDLVLGGIVKRIGQRRWSTYSLV